MKSLVDRCSRFLENDRGHRAFVGDTIWFGPYEATITEITDISVYIYRHNAGSLYDGIKQYSLKHSPLNPSSGVISRQFIIK